MGDPLWINAGKAATAVGTATIATDGTVTLNSHGLGDGDTVVLDSLTGGAAAAFTENAVYYVRDADTDTFTLALTPAGPVVTLSSTGGADVYVWGPQYTAQDLRRGLAVLLYPGAASEFGGRAGVRPHGTDPISVAGTTWTAHDLTAVVNAAGGAYLVWHAEESGSLDPADGSNPRIDALDLQVQDDDEDASGQKRARVVYVAGTPASTPSAPALTANSLRLGTILVPAGGSPGPSVDTQGDMAVASGGILPVRDGEALPTDGVREGVYADRDQALQRHTSGSWVPAASPNTPTIVTYTTSGSFVKGDYPWGHKVVVEVVGGGGGGGGAAASNGTTTAASAGGGGGGGYARKAIAFADLAGSETVTVGAGGAGGAAGDNNGSNGGTSSFGSHCSATGGSGGAGSAASTASSFAAGGFGGSGSGGDVNADGGDGTNGFRAGGEVFAVGAGGNSHLSGVTRSGGSTQGANGLSGAQYGGGGSGGHNRANASGTTNRSGGNGADGVVIVTVY